MAGGTWIDQNKVRPGVYINYKSKPASLAQMGERGTVAIAWLSDWVETHKFYTIEDVSDCEKLGHAISDDDMLFVRQILKGTNRTAGASKILVYTLAGTGAAKATATTGGVVATAKNNGAFGNNLSVSVTGSAAPYVVHTFLKGTEVDAQHASQVSDLVSNDYVDFSAASGGGTKASAVYPAGSTSPSACHVEAAQAGTAGNYLKISFVIDSNDYGVTIYNGATTVGTAVQEISGSPETIDMSTFNSISVGGGHVVSDYVVFSGNMPTDDTDVDIELSGGTDGAATFGPGVLTALTGGSNGTAASSEYAAFLVALEPEKFDVVICDSSDASIKASYCDFVKRLSNDEGQRCQAVVSNLANDSECVISVYNQTVTLNDGTELDSQKLTWWVGGASAGANVNESLTYASHPDAVDVTPKLTASQQESAINSGHIAFISQFGKIQILTDINTFTTFSTNKGRAFRKNRVVRTVFGLCNDIYKTFALYHIGVTDNNDDGRAALKGEILDLMSRYEGNRALQNVNPDDVTVIKGIDSDAVVIEVYCQPVDSIEKIYVNITIS